VAISVEVTDYYYTVHSVQLSQLASHLGKLTKFN